MYNVRINHKVTSNLRSNIHLMNKNGNKNGNKIMLENCDSRIICRILSQLKNDDNNILVELNGGFCELLAISENNK